MHDHFFCFLKISDYSSVLVSTHRHCDLLTILPGKHFNEDIMRCVGFAMLPANVQMFKCLTIVLPFNILRRDKLADQVDHYLYRVVGQSKNRPTVFMFMTLQCEVFTFLHI